MEIKLTHARLLVTDFKACFRFYRDVMGFEVGWGGEDDSYADFKAGSADIALFGQNAMAKEVGTSDFPTHAQSQDVCCLIFSVASVDTAVATLKDRGATFETEPQDHPEWGIRTAHLRDSEGNLIEINEPLQKT